MANSKFSTIRKITTQSVQTHRRRDGPIHGRPLGFPLVPS